MQHQRKARRTVRRGHQERLPQGCSKSDPDLDLGTVGRHRIAALFLTDQLPLIEQKDMVSHFTIAPRHSNASAGASDRHGVSIHVANIYIGNIIRGRVGCFDLRALRVVITTNGDSTSPTAGEEDLC